MKFLVQRTVVHIEGVLKEVKEVCGDKKSQHLKTRFQIVTVIFSVLDAKITLLSRLLL